jgi:hypothetical protein
MQSYRDVMVFPCNLRKLSQQKIKQPLKYLLLQHHPHSGRLQTLLWSLLQANPKKPRKQLLSHPQ